MNQPSQTTRDAAESSAAGGPAWSDATLAGLHDRGDKAERVRAMFAAIARSYDLNNRVHSLWQDQLWRRHAVKRGHVRDGDVVVDVACGTGDLTQAFAERSPAAKVIGIDFTPQMLDLARVKQQSLTDDTGDRIEYRQGDAMALELDDDSVDVLSIAFGIRNVQRPDDAIAEFARVLRPGGRLVILEFDTPKFPPMRWFNDFYAGWVMPRTATIISRDKSGAYRYLPKSVGAFMSREELVGKLETAGFSNVRAKSLSFGICACYSGTLA
ncbi:MAG: bifunctional demethylmenaquinone methyltransferase/2-methoxy-6-polyprenyl-1,4-benzoquinol methylase UbiE [Planctomycetota bacterium]